MALLNLAVAQVTWRSVALRAERVKGITCLHLSDPDREGESIAWHLSVDPRDRDRVRSG